MCGFADFVETAKSGIVREICKINKSTLIKIKCRVPGGEGKAPVGTVA